MSKSIFSSNGATPSESSFDEDPAWVKAFHYIMIEEVNRAKEAYICNLLSKNTSESTYSIEKKMMQLRNNSLTPSELMKASVEMVNANPNEAYLWFFGSATTLGVASFTEMEKLPTLLAVVAQANEAVNLAPNSVAYSFFLASILYYLAELNGRYQDVIKECKRGLLIEDPQDPTQKRRVVDVGILDRLFSEFVKEHIRELMETATRIMDNKVISENREFSEKAEEIQGLNRKKKAIDDEFKAPEDLKINFVFPVKARNQRGSRAQQKKFKDLQNIQAEKQKKLIMDYWKELSVESKRAFLKVDIGDLEKHFVSFKNNSLMEDLKEALDYAKKEKKWMCWFCYVCNENFADSELWRNHMNGKHSGYLEPWIEETLPKVATADEWDRIARTGVWKPMDKSGLESTADSERNEKRSDLIRSVRGMMKSLMSQKCFALTHVEKLKSCARDFLQTLSTELNIENYGLECICFLDVPQLNEVLEFLKDLAISCGLICYTENVVSNLRHVLCIEERIALSSDLSSLFLDTWSLRKECFAGTLVADLNVVGSVPVAAVDDDFANIELPDPSAFVSCLLSGPTIEQHLECLKNIRNGSKSQGNNLLKTIEVELDNLYSCRQKANREHEQTEVCKLDAKILAGVSFKEKALQKLELLCCWDYQLHVVHLLKSFILVKVEESAKKNAAEKAEATGKGLLAELEEERNGKTSVDKLTQTRSSKCTRKNKRRNEDKTNEYCDMDIKGEAARTKEREEAEELKKSLEVSRQSEAEAGENLLSENVAETLAYIEDGSGKSVRFKLSKPLLNIQLGDVTMEHVACLKSEFEDVKIITEYQQKKSGNLEFSAREEAEELEKILQVSRQYDAEAGENLLAQNVAGTLAAINDDGSGKSVQFKHSYPLLNIQLGDVTMEHIACLQSEFEAVKFVGEYQQKRSGNLANSAREEAEELENALLVSRQYESEAGENILAENVLKKWAAIEDDDSGKSVQFKHSKLLHYFQFADVTKEVIAHLQIEFECLNNIIESLQKESGNSESSTSSSSNTKEDSEAK